MALANSRTAYGWVAIGLHWISAVGVVVLYVTGDRAAETVDRAARIAAMAQHISIGVLLLAFLAARVLWSLSQPKPQPLERRLLLRRAAEVVQALFLAMIAVQIVTGPLVVWSVGRPLPVFDWFAIPGPFGGRIGWLHEAAETLHRLAPNLLWPLLALHVLGALKHLIVDRDATVQRMLWPTAGSRRREA
jgi:cytochrome b561